MNRITPAELSTTPRTVVLGASCSGKTTTGKRIAELRGCPCFDLDELAFESNWERVSDAELLRRLEGKIAGLPDWVICGNYTKVMQPVLWPRAGQILWLDLPLSTIIARMFRRTVSRWWTREKVCGDNQESLWNAVAGKDSLVMYTLRTFKRRRRDFERAMDERWVRVRSVAEAGKLIGSEQEARRTEEG
jgi:adenylate kinase family enzyme